MRSHKLHLCVAAHIVRVPAGPYADLNDVRSEQCHHQATSASSFLRWQTLSGSLHHATRYAVRIAIGSWAPVLHIALAISLALPWDADGGTPVCNTVLEGLDVACLMKSCETLVVAFTILL